MGPCRAQGCAKMSYETEAAGRYRMRATRLRVLAKAYKDQETARTVLRVAENYELMAQVFDDTDQAGLAAIKSRNSN